MRKKLVAAGPFGGLMTSLEETAIPATRASDMLNVRVEDGRCRPRYGYAILRAPQSGFAANYGYDYLEGFTSSNVQQSEFVSYENLGVAVRPYHRLPGESSPPTEIMAGVSSVSLHASMWRAVSWQNFAYLFNPNDTVGTYRYEIGNYTSLTATNKTTAPTAPLTYAVTYGGKNTPYTQQKFTGVDPAADITYTSPAQATNSVVNADGSLTIGHTASTRGMGKVKIQLNGATGPGLKDWTYNDVFAFTVDVGTTGDFQINPNSMQVLFYNNAGTVLVPSNTLTRLIIVQNPGQDVYAYKVEFYDKSRSDFDDIKYIELEYEVIRSGATATNDLLRIKPWFVGGVRVLPEEDLGRQRKFLTFGYTYTNAVGETGLGGELEIPFSALAGYDPYGGFGNDPEKAIGPLGVHLRLTATTASVTSWTLYLYDQTADPPVWLQVANTAIATLTYDYKITYAEAVRLTVYNPQQFKSTDVVDAFQFKGWMVWLYQGGYQNIRHSAVGLPERQQSDLDPVIGGPNGQGDETRGATFSMADNFGDEPLAGFACGDVCVYVGETGVYAQVGDAPFKMTACKRVPGSFGCPGKLACCRWRDEFGNPGVVALSHKGEGVYFYSVNPDFDGVSRGFSVRELSIDIRPTLRSYLMTGQSLSDFSTAVVRVDNETDSLWIVMGKRALVLRRPSLVDGKRQFEVYRYTLSGNAEYAPFSMRWGARWMGADGSVILVDRNLSGTPITGASRDGGSAMPTPYWQSKVFTSADHTRIDVADVYRDDLTNTPTLTVNSTRQSSSRTLTSGRRKTRFGPKQQGTEHQLKLTIGENDSPYHRVVLDVLGPVGRRVRS